MPSAHWPSTYIYSLLSIAVFLTLLLMSLCSFFFFFQAEDGIRDDLVTGVQTCALPIYNAIVISSALPFPSAGPAARFQAGRDAPSDRCTGRRASETERWESGNIAVLTKIGRASCRERV